MGIPYGQNSCQIFIDSAVFSSWFGESCHSCIITV